MWTYEDNDTLIENIIVRAKYKDGVHKNNTLLPVNGYMIHFKNQETQDEEGNSIEPSYSSQVILPIASSIYDYEAVKID
jgi:hypothetical protein